MNDTSIRTATILRLAAAIVEADERTANKLWTQALVAGVCADVRRVIQAQGAK